MFTSIIVQYFACIEVVGVAWLIVVKTLSVWIMSDTTEGNAHAF